MKAVILAAGYGTRLLKEVQQLEQNPLNSVTAPGVGVAKALIQIKGKPLTEHLIDKIKRAGLKESDIYIVTNAVFYGLFLKWSQTAGCAKENIVNDGSLSNETRLGAAADLLLAIEQKNIAEKLLVIAGDTLFNFGLENFVSESESLTTDLVAYYLEKDLAAMSRRGMIMLDENEKVVGFEEKPQQPDRLTACPSLYVFQAQTLKLLPKFLSEKTELSQKDGPGFFIKWLIENGQDITGHKIPGRFDLGTLMDCLRAEREFKP